MGFKYKIKLKKRLRLLSATTDMIVGQFSNKPQQAVIIKKKPPK
jgi:hypothetical protein